MSKIICPSCGPLVEVIIQKEKSHFSSSELNVVSFKCTECELTWLQYFECPKTINETHSNTVNLTDSDDHLKKLRSDRGSKYGSIIENCLAAQSLAYYTTGDKISLRGCLAVIIGMKHNRAKHSPNEADHYDDNAVYEQLLKEVSEWEDRNGPFHVREIEKDEKHNLLFFG